MGWLQDYSDMTATADRAGNRTAKVGYVFDGPIDPLALAIHPESFLGGVNGNEPLARVGSPHHADPTLKLDRYDVDRTGDTSRFYALYSNSSQFSDQPPDDDPQTNKIIGYSSSRVDVVVDIPYGKSISSVAWYPLPPDQQGPPVPVVKKYWKLETFRVREARRTRSWKVLIAEADIAAAEAVMDKQDGKLHNILGTWYLYKSSDVTPTGIVASDGAKLFEITHSWARDGGTPFPSPVPPIDKYWFHNWDTGLNGTFPSGPGAEWLRPPFHAVNAAPSEDNVSPPEFVLIMANKIDANGWRELPGLNI